MVESSAFAADTGALTHAASLVLVQAPKLIGGQCFEKKAKQEREDKKNKERQQAELADKAMELHWAVKLSSSKSKPTAAATRAAVAAAASKKR